MSRRIDETIAAAVDRLDPVSDSARLDAEILLSRALDVDRSYLFGHPDDTLDPQAEQRFEELLARRADGVPMAYIIGRKEFWSLDLMVTPDTLVPRPETELLVQEALARLPADAPADVVDLGTGCGAIALAIAKERPLARVTATDSDPAALAVAEQNARHLGLPNLSFVEGSWTDPLTGAAFDLVVSNPPYVKEDDPALDALQHEPAKALVSGGDGLDDIRILGSNCRDLLRQGGALLLEHGADQERDVARILQENGWSDILCRKDLAGLPRVTSASSG